MILQTAEAVTGKVVNRLKRAEQESCLYNFEGIMHKQDFSSNIQSETTKYDIVFSVLSFHSEEQSVALLSNMLPMIHQCANENAFSYLFIMRDNSPTKSQYLEKTVRKLAAEGLQLVLSQGPNVGFGLGHNMNFAIAGSDIFCILNNDMAFQDVLWLPSIMCRIREEKELGAIGIDQEKFALNEFFGFANRTHDNSERMYLDGSLLFVRSDVFREIDGFDETYGLAYFEDTDFSLRLRSRGYRLGVHHIPHRHYRSSSTARMPTSFYSSIYEKGRAVFFSRWSEYLEKGLLSNKVLIDCDHDGIGDFFLGLFPLRAFLTKMHRKGFKCTVKVRHENLAFLLHDIEGVDIVSADYVEGDAFVRRIRMSSPNMSLPVLSCDLISAFLGEVQFSEDPADIAKLLPVLSELPGLEDLVDCRYVVCHFESTRTGFAGRTVTPERAKSIIGDLIRRGKKIVLIGSAQRGLWESNNSEPEMEYSEHLIDLRGHTTIKTMVSLVGRAEFFVGIDSGPANIAMSFGVPGFVIYGATSPATKIYRENMKHFVNKKLDCTGCYHLNVEYAYNTCFRDDEACMREIRSEELLAELHLALDSAIGKLVSNVSVARYRKLQREHIMQLMHNPVHRSKLYGINGFIGKNFSDTVVELVDVIGRRAAHQMTDVVRKLAAAEEANRELLRRVHQGVEQHSGLSSVGPTPGSTRARVSNRKLDNVQRTAGTPTLDLDNLFQSRNKPIACDVALNNGRAEVSSLGDDPQILLKPIRINDAETTFLLSARSSEETGFRIYWSTQGPYFTEGQSIGLNIDKQDRFLDVCLPLNAGDLLYIRLDPAERRCNVTFEFQVFGAAEVSDALGFFSWKKIWSLLNAGRK